MSTESREPAHRALFISLINDASLFPPAKLPMDEALVEHARHRAAPESDLVGPFLVAASSVPDFTTALDAGAQPPPSVGLIARPGTPTQEIDAALTLLREESRTRLASLDTAWTAAWRNLDIGDLPVNLEVGRDGAADAMDDITSASDFVDVRAKFRTGPTPEWTWPDADELAGFMLTTSQRHLPFVLTGGLHHVVRGEYRVHGAPEPQHGLLNVLVAVHACSSGADEQTVRDLLELREPEEIADIVSRWSAPDIAAVRAAFVGFGCCDVTDPIGELTDLGLLAVQGD